MGVLALCRTKHGPVSGGETSDGVGLAGYGELMGWRKRNRLLDPEKPLWLLRCDDPAEFRKHLNATLDEAMIHDEPRRKSKMDGVYRRRGPSLR